MYVQFVPHNRLEREGLLGLVEVVAVSVLPYASDSGRLVRVS